MDHPPRAVNDTAQPRRCSGGRLAVLCLLLMALLMLAAPVTAGAAPIPQEQTPTCQSCHAEEHDVWKNSVHAGASLSPQFQEQLAKAHDQGDCLKCHASSAVTGEVPTGSDKVMAEGVTCEACHGAYQPGHPAETTMKLPVESAATCRTCHDAAYATWEKSAHAEKNIECFDCHLAHSQGVRTGSVDKLCSACHSDQATQAAHSRHGINGVNCTSCHMAKQMTTMTDAGEDGAQVTASSHSFMVAADVCSGCHAGTIHTGGSPDAAASAGLQASRTSAAATGADAQPASSDEKAVTELRTQVGDLQQRLTSLRDMAVISIGLAFGVGGFMGLVVGLAGMAIWKRSRRTS